MKGRRAFRYIDIHVEDTGRSKMKSFIPFFLLIVSAGLLWAADLDKAILHYEMGEFREAVNLLTQSGFTPSRESEIRLWLGKSHLKLHEWDRAIKEIERAVELNPSDALYHLWLGRAYGAKASHTVFFKALGWARRVARAFETAVRLAPDNLDARFDLLDFYINAPGMVGGGRDKAEAQAAAIAKLDPRKGYVARAMIFEKDKRRDLAMKELIQATKDYPQDADAHKDLADFYLAGDEFEKALASAQRALALDPNSKRSLLIREASRIRSRAGLDKAETALRELAAGRLRDEDPPREELYYWLGECHLAKGEPDKARRSFLTALSFNPDYEPAKKSLSKMR